MDTALMGIGCFVLLMGMAMADDSKKDTQERILCGLVIICGTVMMIAGALIN